MVDYKLRLGDGTTFSVDEKGLTTWLQGGLIDDKARVQPAGSKKWFSLKQVLAAQGAQRGHAERQTVKGRADVDRQAAEETAEIERKVAEQRATEERKAAEELAAAERKAEEDRTAAERKIIQEREAAVRRAAEERAAAEAHAAAERQAEQERVEAERRAAEERAAAERSAAEAREAEAERLVAAERAERAERKRKAEEARLEAEQQAAEDARLAAERKAAEDRAAAARRETEAREAAAREAARVAEAERQVAAERAERAERKRRADEERAREREEASHAFHVSDLSEPPATEIAIEPAAAATEIAIEPATMVKVEDFERELGLNPVTFSDGTGAPSARESPALRTDRATHAPSLDRSESRPSSRGEEAAGRGEEPARSFVKPPTAVDNGVMRLLKVLDRGVIWVVRSLVPLVGDAVARSVRSLKSAGPKLTNAIPNLKGVAPKLKGLLARGAEPTAPAPAGDMPAAASTVDPAPWSAPAPPPAPLAVREPPRAPEPPRTPEHPRTPLKPPPSFQKVDVIPFAAASAPSASDRQEEVWDGEDAWQEPGAVASMFAVLWLWVKRVTIATALIGTTALLYLNKEKWLPQAESAAIVLGQGVDELSDRVPRTVPPAAIEAAHAQVQYLRPQTIELIMAESTEGVLAPVEVFRRAHQAAERARPSLPTTVAAEIDHHMAAVAAELDPGEAEQLSAYFATVRAGTPTAAYQDQAAAWLMARGVKRLGAERVARMQELFAQAVTLALQPPV